ncbi:MAG TPA: metallophosphoesterase [Polyangia bacterium]
MPLLAARRPPGPPGDESSGDSASRAGRNGSPIALRRFAGPARYVGELSHLRIAHLTDLHVGRVTPYEIQRHAVALANAQHPDLVVITGDFVCHSQLYLDQLTALMREFKAPVIGVLGNHDYWAGAGEVRHALQRGGVEMLANNHTTITLRHQKLQVVGLDDAYTGHARRDEAVKGLRSDLPTLGLSHIAEEADGLWRHNVPLVLAGHTHGGQVTFARLHEIALGRLAGHRYVHGLYGSRTAPAPDPENPEHAGDGHGRGDGRPEAHRKGKPAGAVYVGAGIGAAVIPLRLGERGKREVTIFELGQAPGSFAEHHAEQVALLGRKPSQAVTERRAAAVVRKKDKRARKRTREWDEA